MAFSYNAPTQTARLTATLAQIDANVRAETARTCMSSRGAGEAKGQCGTAGGHLLIRSRHGAR